MRIATALLLFTASLLVGCVSERNVLTNPMIGSLRDGSGPAPAITPATLPRAAPLTHD
jgi:hypothetical protein